MISWPLVSVIIPVFNAEKYLRLALDSALQQDYPCLEIIAVDDGGTDGSRSILSEYSDRIKVIYQENRGSGRARNVGLFACKGKYIAFLDADDFWHPSKTRIQVEQLEIDREVGLVYNEWLVVDESESSVKLIEEYVEVSPAGEKINFDEAGSGFVYCQLLTDCIVHTSSAMLRADLVREVGPFDEDLIRGQDYDYWLRLSRLTQFRKLARILSAYRVHARGVSQNIFERNYDAIVIGKALDNWGRKGPDGQVLPYFALRGRLATIWYRFGNQHLRAKEYEVATKSFLKSYAYAPWRLRYLGRCLQSAYGIARH